MYKKLIVDTDTALYRAAKSVQEDYINVLNKKTGVKMEFSNQTEFWGHWKKKEGGWLKTINEFFGSSYKPESFEIEELARVSQDFDDPLEEAERQFDFFVGRLKALKLAEDYELVIGGDGNFRYDVAKQLPYKGNRGPKPIIFEELKELLLDKYKTKIKVINGMEADDYLSIKGWENYNHHRKTGEWKYLLAYIDKDLDMIISPSINPDKLDEGIEISTPQSAARAFCGQLLTGDMSVDNIPGLPNLTQEICDKYGVRKTRGLGKASADSLLKDCNIKEMFERVVEAYKSYYGEEKKNFTTAKGDVEKWNWLDYLQDTAILLWMCRKQNERYSITETLDKLGVEY